MNDREIGDLDFAPGTRLVLSSAVLDLVARGAQPVSALLNANEFQVLERNFTLMFEFKNTNNPVPKSRFLKWKSFEGTHLRLPRVLEHSKCSLVGRLFCLLCKIRTDELCALCGEPLCVECFVLFHSIQELVEVKRVGKPKKRRNTPRSDGTASSAAASTTIPLMGVGVGRRLKLTLDSGS